MKTTPLIILIGSLISCIQQPKQESADMNTTKHEAGSQAQIDQLRWGEAQDSLRTQLLNSRPNENLKSGILAEPYIRGLVTVVNDTYQVILPFDLHGFDCGAPDCYTTDLTFNMPITNPLMFPKTLEYKISEHGCVNQATTVTGTFELQEQTEEYVNYYSETERSNLLLFKEDARKEFIYYFPEAEPDSIKAELVSELLEGYNEEDPEAIAPFRITTMLTREYERFLKD